MTMRGLAVALAMLAPWGAAAQQVDYRAARSLVQETLAGKNTGQQAMEVGVLVYGPQGGMPIQRAAHLAFFTGERFKLKILSSRAGTLQVVNIEPTGRENRLTPMPVAAGSETLYPAEPNKFLEFDATAGDELLRLTLLPSGQALPAAPSMPAPASAQAPAGDDFGGLLALLEGTGGSASAPPAAPPSAASGRPGADALFDNVEGKAYVAAGKGIHEVVLEAPSATQVVQPISGAGLVYDLKLKHR